MEEEKLAEMSLVESAKAEIVSFAANLDSYIEENSSRNLEFMKFEAVDRMKVFVEQYEKLAKAASLCEENFKNNSEINILENEVEWYQKRVNNFLAIQQVDKQKIEKYKQFVKTQKKTNENLEKELKAIKNKIFQFSTSQNQPKAYSPLRKTKLKQIFNNSNTYNFSLSEQEQYNFLFCTQKNLQKKIENIKEEIRIQKSEEFKSRNQMLPVEEFFNECYKSVYHFLFQRQSQLDEFQLSLAYKMFREQKMEYSNIVHRSHANTTRYENYVVRDALISNNKTKIKVMCNKKEKNKGVGFIS